MRMETYIDSHTHLHFEEFDRDREAVMARARQAGVEQIISLGTDLFSSRQNLQLTRQFPEVFAAAGIHPSEAHRARPGDVEAVKTLAQSDPRVVAVGEIGLDFYWDSTYHREQYEIFREMLRIAGEIDKPVVIHNRAAQREMEWFFQEAGIETLDGVMHCFAGEVIDARFYLEMGLHISFTANITFRNFRAIDVIRCVPLERLLLETDSPYIAPAGTSEKRNEPANVIRVAEKIAEIYRLPREEIARITTENARRLFRLPDPAL